MVTTGAQVITGDVLTTALRELLEPAAMPVFATEDRDQANLLAYVERIVRALRGRQQTSGIDDLWSRGPFDNELFSIVRMRKLEGAVAVAFGEQHADGCIYCPGSPWAIIGALLEVGLTNPSKTVLAEQRTLAVRLLAQGRGTPNRHPAFGCLQISSDEVYTAVYQLPAAPTAALAARVRGTQGSSFWVKSSAARTPPLRHFTADFPGLLRHLSGHSPTPPARTPA